MDTVVKNYFKAADKNGDNALVVGGTAETEGGQSLKTRHIDVNLADVSTASTVYVNCPYAGTITKITAVLQDAITTANANLSAKIGANAITGGDIVVAEASSAAGDAFSASPSAANVVAAGDVISVATDGGSTGTAPINIQIEIAL
jgi:hypothetical protein